jgi:hypothetical protein
MYENRPIHWPLCSANKTFVAWVNIHRMNANTLKNLITDHLRPAHTNIKSNLEGLSNTDAKSAELRNALIGQLSELNAFIDLVTECSQRGPARATVTTGRQTKMSPPREVDALYDPNLDDGVMINSAALWPLLYPQWRKPQEWWMELSNAAGRKDYDWSHLAMRYWPQRVDAKCKEDPSLGVAHGCFWAYHPARAWAWELRLQDEISQDFRITESPYPLLNGDTGDGPHRRAYLQNEPEEALKAVEKEAKRRLTSLRKPVQAEKLKALMEDVNNGKLTEKKAKSIAKTHAEKEVTLNSLTLLESGLWTTHSKLCRLVEVALTKANKNDVSFQLLAPDAPDRPTQVAAQSDLNFKV